MAKIIAVLRDRQNGDPVASEDVNFRNPAGTILDTESTSADGSATYLANGNPAGLIKWDATVSGEQREASARAMRQIGAFFEAELAKSFLGIVSNGVSPGDGDECAVVPGSGRQVTVGTGCVWVQGIPFHFYTDTNLSTTANASLAVRKDYVVLRVVLDDSLTTYGQGTLVVVEGTVNNTNPTLTQSTTGTYEYPLALVTSAMGFSSYTAGNIADTREGVAPASHVHVMADVTDLAAALALKATLASPTFTGTVTAPTTNINGVATVTANGDPAFLVQGSGGADILYVTQTYNAVQVVNSAELSLVNGAPGVGSKTFAIDGATGHVTVGGVTLTPTELSYLDGVSSNIQSQINAITGAGNISATSIADGSVTNTEFQYIGTLSSNAQTQIDAKASTASVALKANTASPTFTGTVTVPTLAVQNFAHDNGTYGFNGETNSGRFADPADISSGTIDATYGSAEATILSDLRDNVNTIKTILRDLGIMSA